MPVWRCGLQGQLRLQPFHGTASAKRPLACDAAALAALQLRLQLARMTSGGRLHQSIKNCGFGEQELMNVQAQFPFDISNSVFVEDAATMQQSSSAAQLQL